MATEWYIKIRSKVHGPFSNSQLREKVRNRTVTESTPVRKDDSQWVAAISINGLFQTAGVATSDLRCPYCGLQIIETPTICPQCQRKVEVTV